MAAELESLSSIQRKITLTIPADSISQEVQKRFNDLTPKVRIDGFRRGKVPHKLIKERFSGTVYSEAISALIQKTYEAAIAETGVHPASYPEITPVTEKVDENQPFIFSAIFEVFPEIEIKDFSTLTIEKLNAELEDSDIDKAIDKVREQRASQDEKGEKQLPELTEEFIATLGVKGNLDDLKKEVRKNLERELKYAKKNKLKSQVIEKLMAAHEFEIPKAMVEREAERMREQSKRYFKQMKIKQPMLDIPLDLFKENAAKNVKIGLLFSKIIEQYKIEPTEEMINEQIHDMATMYDNIEEAVEWIRSDKRQLEDIRAQAREAALVDKVLEKAQVTEKILSYEELMKEGRE